MNKNRAALLAARLTPGTTVTLKSDDSAWTVVGPAGAGKLSLVDASGEEMTVALAQVVPPDRDAGAAELRQVCGVPLSLTRTSGDPIRAAVEDGTIGRDGKAIRKTGPRLPKPDAAKLAVRPVNEARRLGTEPPKVAKTAAVRAPRVAGAAPQPKATRACCCGCGEQVTGWFRMGHDARFHGWMKKIARGKMGANEIPATAAKLMTIVAGRPTTDYDGSDCAKWLDATVTDAGR